MRTTILRSVRQFCEVCLILCLGHIALRSVIVSWPCVLKAETPLQLVVQSMDVFTFKIWQGQEDVTVVKYASPLSVAQAKQALLEENASWIGALQEEGSSIRVGGDQQLKPGSSYILTLQSQAGEWYLLLSFFQHMGLEEGIQPLLCLAILCGIHQHHNVTSLCCFLQVMHI